MNGPSNRKCSICKDVKGMLSNQYCLSNTKHPNYKFDSDDMLTHFDCWSFICSNETEEEWKERIKKSSTTQRPQT